MSSDGRRGTNTVGLTKLATTLGDCSPRSGPGTGPGEKEDDDDDDKDKDEEDDIDHLGRL